MSALSRGQDAARSADLKVPHGDLEAGSEGSEVTDGGETLGGDFGQDLVLTEQEPGVCPPAGAADPSADLVQLRQSEMVRILHDKGVAVGDIHSRLDDGGTDEDIALPFHQLLPDFGEGFLVHLSVGHFHPGFRDHISQFVCRPVDGLHPVVQVVHLTAAAEFSLDGVADGGFVVLRHIGLDRMPVHRRVLDDAHVTDPAHCHVQRSRDRGSGKGEHIHIGELLLEFLLVGNTEALLLVDDEQSQFLELNVLLEQPVRSHSNIHRSVADPCHPRLDLFGGGEPGQHGHLDGIGLHPLQDGAVVLKRQDGGGNEEGDLVSVRDGLEGGAQRHLGLPDSHIAAQQAVHGLSGLHVLFDLVAASQLVIRLLIREAQLKIPLPVGVLREGDPLGLLPLGIELDQFLRHLPDRAVDLLLGLLPLSGIEAVQRHLAVILRRDVRGDHIQSGDRHIQGIPVPVAYLDVIRHKAVVVDAVDAVEDADAVVPVDDIVPHLQVLQTSEHFGGFLRPLGDLPHLLRLVGGGDERDLQRRDLESGGQHPLHHRDLSLIREPFKTGLCRDPFRDKVVAQRLCAAVGTSKHRHTVARVEIALQVLLQDGHLPGPAGDRVGVQVHDGLERDVPHSAGEDIAQDPVPAGHRFRIDGIVLAEDGVIHPVGSQGFHIKSIAFHKGTVPLLQFLGLRQEYHSLRQIVQDRFRRRIAGRHIAVGADRQDSFLQFRKIPLHRSGQLSLRQFLHKFPDGLHRVVPQGDLPCGRDLAAGPVHGPALGIHGKFRDPLDLGVKELHTDRHIPVHGEHVQDAAPLGILSPAFHLVAAGVSRGDESRAERPDLRFTALLQYDPAVQVDVSGHGEKAHGLQGTADRLQLPSRGLAESGEPGDLLVMGDTFHIQQSYLPGRERLHLGEPQRSHVLRRAVSVPVAVAHKDHRSARCHGESRRGHGPVDLMYPEESRGLSGLFHRCDEVLYGFAFGQFLKDGHMDYFPFPLYLLWARVKSPPIIRSTAPSMSG